MGSGVALPPIASPGGPVAEGLNAAEGMLRKGVWGLSNTSPFLKALAGAAMQYGTDASKSVGQDIRMNYWVGAVKDKTGWSIDRSDPNEEAALRDFDRAMVANPEALTPAEVQENFNILQMTIRDIKGNKARAVPQATTGARVDDDSPCRRTVIISRAASPQAAKHIDDAQAAGQPKTLTLDRIGADARRAASTSKLPIVPGMDRDEYPPATFLEGGATASVRHIPIGDNRSAGGQLKAQMNRPVRAVEGCRVTIITGP